MNLKYQNYEKNNTTLITNLVEDKNKLLKNNEIIPALKTKIINTHDLNEYIRLKTIIIHEILFCKKYNNLKYHSYIKLNKYFDITRSEYAFDNLTKENLDNIKSPLFKHKIK